MAFTQDIYAIMTQIQPVLLTVYSHYFQAELNATKVKQSLTELTGLSFESCFQFLKDFRLCPYVVSKKLVFYVWYTVSETKNESLLLTNDSRNSSIVIKDIG